MLEKYQPEYKLINIKDLKLDTDNPRLPKSLQAGVADEDAILNYMLLDASLSELMIAIGVNGFFPGEQLLVVLDKRDGKYKVIEGNRRLSALILLNHPQKAKVMTTQVEKVIEQTTERPKDIPCLVFDKEEGIHMYLGYRHITGIKEWKLLQKARYLYSLRVNNYKSLPITEAAKEIAKVIGSRKDYVSRILVGFEIYKVIEDNAFFKIIGLDDTTFYFNYIADSLNKSNIAKFLGIDFEKEEPTATLVKDNLEKWTRWLFEKVGGYRARLLGDSEDLADLNTILGNDNARLAFDERNFTLAQAKELTGETDDRFQIAFQKAVSSLESADNLVVKVNTVYGGFEDDLKAIRTLIKKIKLAVDEVSDEEE